MSDFSTQLRSHQTRTGLTAAQLCRHLHDIPYRTYMSWKNSSQTPAPYIQALVLEKLSTLPPKKKTHPMIKS